MRPFLAGAYNATRGFEGVPKCAERAWERSGGPFKREKKSRREIRASFIRESMGGERERKREAQKILRDVISTSFRDVSDNAAFN